MKTTIIICLVFAALIAGFSVQLWEHGYKRGHADATAVETARANFNASYIRYFDKAQGGSPSVTPRQAQYTRQQIVSLYEELMAMASNPDLPKDSFCKATEEIIEDTQRETLAYLDQLIEERESSTK